MDIIVNWKELDQESKDKKRSLAKIAELKIGNKVVTSPSRGIKIGATTSDFKVWNEVTRGVLNPHGLGFLHMGIVPETATNITKTNGKFNEKVGEMDSHLSVINNDTVKILYPRIAANIAETVPFNEEMVRAFLFFLEKVSSNEMKMAPLPPLKKVIDNFNIIEKSLKSVNEVSSNPKPFVGYVPNFDDPLMAAKLVDKYLHMRDNINFFVIDFSNGRRERTIFEVMTKLLDAKNKKEIGDFYVHGVNVPKDNNNLAASPIYDLTTSIEGIDSFNNILWPAGGGGPKKNQPVLEYNKGRKYAVASQYGSFSYAELAARKLLKNECNCPVCKNQNLEDLFKTGDYRQLMKMLSVHRMFVDMSELDEYGRTLKEQDSVVDYLRLKPMVKNDVDTIVSSLRFS